MYVHNVMILVTGGPQIICSLFSKILAEISFCEGDIENSSRSLIALLLASSLKRLSLLLFAQLLGS